MKLTSSTLNKSIKVCVNIGQFYSYFHELIYVNLFKIIQMKNIIRYILLILELKVRIETLNKKNIEEKTNKNN